MLAVLRKEVLLLISILRSVDMFVFTVEKDSTTSGCYCRLLTMVAESDTIRVHVPVKPVSGCRHRAG